ncbi:MAG TPA: histidine kinase [Solirubrobacteraceae bacterium]|nr:histidine kinase [Solirubrobacteraceae bacterium]
MSAQAQAPTAGNGAPPISAHFVNNVLAAAASYIDDDPDLARDVLAELGQFLSYLLRDDRGAVAVSQELAHTATYLRLQQARFPGRITTDLPAPEALAATRVAPGAIQGPIAEALGRRLRERAGACALTVRPAQGGLEVELAGEDGAPAERLAIALGDVSEATA